MVDLLNAESADLRGGVEGGGPGNDVPSDVVRDTHLFHAPDMSAQLGGRPVLWFPEV